MKRKTILGTLFLCTVCASVICLSSCKDSGTSADTPPPPKVGLVFGGGGAKAAAQIGVIKRLEELGIQADYVSGTSMGAVIGALYAAGYSAKELEEIMLKERWLWIYDKSTILALRKGDGRKLTGVVARPYFQSHLDSLLNKKGVHLYTDTKIPFKCTGTTVKLKELCEEVLHEGVISRDLATTTAFPGAYFFVKHEGKLMLDGGMMNNLPVDLVRADADVVIAMDLECGEGSELIDLAGLFLDLTKDIPVLGSSLKRLCISKWLKERPDVTKREANIAQSDIYINPPLDSYSIKDYNEDDIKKMIEIGYNACLDGDIEDKLEKLK